MRLTGLIRQLERTDNILSAYRTLIFYRLAVAGVLFLLPFIIHHFLEGRVVLVCATLAIGLCLRAADMMFRVGGEEFAILMPGYG
jgi:hypothetical protein